ncbi:MAG: hypothetical protein ACRD8U_11055 [Pyrinomonadaceae bacterium]
MDTKKNETTPRSLKDTLQERLNEAKASSGREGPQGYLIHRQIRLGPHHTPTGKTKHYEGEFSSEGLERGVELKAPHRLAIVQIPPEQGYYLLYLDEEGNELTDTYHDSLEAALEQAEWEFNVGANEWENMKLQDREDPGSRA